MKYVCLLLIQSFFAVINPLKGERQTLNSDGIYLIISNIRNTNGLIQVGVFESEKGYPDNPAYSFSLSKDTITAGRLRLFIPLKTPGTCGISILDDENSNGKMDYLLRIIPREGFGFSNNPKITGRKPPPFSQTDFKFPGGKKTISVSMVYI
jgi:uncharacterized protein (DUF2141 family)